MVRLVPAGIARNWPIRSVFFLVRNRGVICTGLLADTVYSGRAGRYDMELTPLVSKLLFVKFFIQFFKTIICFIWFDVSRLFFSHTQKTFYIFIHPFQFYFFIYTCPQPFMSCNLKYIQTKNNVVYLQPSSLQPYNDTYITLTLSYHLILTCMSRLRPRKGACFFFFFLIIILSDGSLRFLW